MTGRGRIRQTLHQDLIDMLALRTYPVLNRVIDCIRQHLPDRTFTFFNPPLNGSYSASHPAHLGEQSVPEVFQEIDIDLQAQFKSLNAGEMDLRNAEIGGYQEVF